RRAWLRRAGASVLSGLAVACASAPAPAPTVPQSGSAVAPVSTRIGASSLTMTLANSELAVGLNRFAMALVENGRPIANATVRYEFFQVDGQAATKRSETEAAFRSLESGGKGLYVARVDFDRAGSWGVQATVSQPDRPPMAGRSSFQVQAQSSAPMPGA